MRNLCPIRFSDVSARQTVFTAKEDWQKKSGEEKWSGARKGKNRIGSRRRECGERRGNGKEVTAKEAALDEENEAVIKEKAEETARELSAAAAVDINFVADGTPLAENSAQNFEQNGNEPKIGKIEDEIAPAAVAQAAGTAVIMPFASSGKTYDFHVNKVKKKPVYAAVKRIFDLPFA